jgi:signal transduction histidine kinase
MGLGLREKTIAITTSILLLTVGLNTLIGTHVFQANYATAIASESHVIGLNLRSQLQRILQLGIPVQDIEGFDQQCRDIVATHKDVAYAMILQTDGRVLFHSDLGRDVLQLQDARLLRAVAQKREALCPADLDGQSYDNTILPIDNSVRDGLGTTVVIGVPTELVQSKTRRLMLLGLGTGLASSVAATILLLLALSASVTRPLAQLLTTIRQISASSDLSKRVEITSHDELGVLAGAFNRMTEDLQRTTTSVNNLNREIAVRRNAEEGQAALIDQINHINKELQDFAYVISHDLKAPLRGIKTLAEWITEDCAPKLDDQNKEQLGLLMNRVDRMHNLIDGVLQYSRVGRVEEQRKPVDLNQLLPEIIDTLQPPPHIHVTIAGTLPTIECGPTHLTQVFQNLLSNAIKYMDKPEGDIRVGCTESDAEWTFTIADNGPGIEEKYFEQIFRLFQTLSRKDTYESTGIGLTVTKKIIEQYGGRIRLESKIGAGSTFVFTMPKRKSTPTT